MKQPESMARRIRRAIVLVGVICVTLTALGTAVLFQRAFGNQLDRDLERTAAAIAEGYRVQGGGALDGYLDAGDSLRLTLIDPDGNVLYDSTGATDMENHLDRPEVRQALDSGRGADTRHSRTLGYETHYYAIRLSDGNVLRLADDTGDLWSAYNRALPLLIVGVVLVLALGALLAWLLTRALVRPITRMAEHLDSIEAEVPYEELALLAHTVQSDRKLREDNEAIRREFTANVSHELKTPLTSISGYAELMENGMTKSEDVPVFAQRIHKEASRMITLVTDILQLSELDGMRDSKEKSFEPEPVDLAAITRDTCVNMTMNARKAYVTLQYKAEPASLMGSRDLLSELVTNLCDNAIRYNRPGGHVTLYSGPDGDGGPYFAVEDNGIGIPQDAQARVFERFYRVDKSRSKATGGTGLGLAIVKHIAMLHGARIDLKSQVGTGTTIRVTFPKP